MRTFRYIGVVNGRGSHVAVTMERDHQYIDEDTGQRTLERTPAGHVTMTTSEWGKLKKLLYECPMPDGYEYEVHEG